MAVSKLKSFSYFSAANYVPAVVGFSLLPIFTNYLTPSDYGIRAIVLLAIIIFQVFSDLGTNWIIRGKYFEIKAKDDLASLISTLLIISLIIRIFVAIIIINIKDYIYPPLFPNWSYIHDNLLSVNIIILFLGFSKNLVIPVIILEKRVKSYLMLTIGTYAINIGSALYFLVWSKKGLISLFYGELAGAIFFAIFSMSLLWEYKTLRLSKKAFEYILRIGLPAMPKNIISQVQSNINKYFLQLYMMPSDLGIFQKSGFVYTGFRGLLKSIGNTVAPSNIKKLTEKEEDNETGLVIIQFIYFISILLVMSILYLESVFKFMGVNESFWICAVYAPLYGFSVLISPLATMYVHNVLVSEKTYLLVYQTIINLLSTIILNLILIPVYGIMGAIISAIIVSFISLSVIIIINSKVLSYETNLNFGAWSILLLLVVFIFLLNYFNYLTFFSSKLIVFVLYVVSIFILDLVFVKAVRWDKILYKKNYK